MNKYKVALVAISLNENYWQYISPMIQSARKFFLKGHDVDFIVWTDMPKEMGDSMGAKVIPTAPFEWPLPTLFRYSLFLKEEALLREYDYVFYCDADMAFVSRVGDEILGEGLTIAQHPMYATAKMFVPPYEPNEKSESYIPRLGRVTTTNGKKIFQPLYLAGGFQGGRTDLWISAMQEMKEMIDKDFSKNYIPIWNDETAWNAYLFKSGLDKDPKTIVLNPSYIYPDSLNKVYYQKVWGRNYVPKLVTITKKFSLTKQGADNLALTLKKL